MFSSSSRKQEPLTATPLLGPATTVPCDPVLFLGAENWFTAECEEILQHDLAFAKTSCYAKSLDAESRLKTLHMMDGKTLLELTEACGGSVLVQAKDLVEANEQTKTALDKIRGQKFQAVIVADYIVQDGGPAFEFLTELYNHKVAVVWVAIRGYTAYPRIQEMAGISWRFSAYTKMYIQLTEAGRRILGNWCFPKTSTYTKANYIDGDGEELFVEYFDSKYYYTEEEAEEEQRKEEEREANGDDFDIGREPMPCIQTRTPVLCHRIEDGKCVSFFGFVNPLDVSYGGILLRLCYANRRT